MLLNKISTPTQFGRILTLLSPFPVQEHTFLARPQELEWLEVPEPKIPYQRHASLVRQQDEFWHWHNSGHKSTALMMPCANNSQNHRLTF